MTPEPVEPAARHGLAERYEQLRAAALGGGADGWRMGLGVLAGKGVPGWIRAASTCASGLPVGPAPDPGRGCPTAGPHATELVRVLAAMTLAHA